MTKFLKYILAIPFLLLFTQSVSAIDFEYLHSYPLSNGYRIDYPYGMDSDASGNIYVTDQRSIKKFSSTGTFMAEIGLAQEFDLPIDVEIASNGYIYVLDKDGARVLVYNSSGVFQYQFGTAGSGDGQFSSPFGMGLDSSNNVYIADAGNYRVQKFDSLGNFLLKFGTFGGNDGQFNTITDVAVMSDGNIVASDGAETQVQIFSSVGAHIATFGSLGSGNGQFDFPWRIALDSSNNIYVSDSSGYRIQKFNSSGVYQSQFGSFGSGDNNFEAPRALTVDSSNNVWVGDENLSVVKKFNSSFVYQLTVGVQSSQQGQLWNPQGVALDSTGRVYIASANDSIVNVYNNDGTFVTSFGSEGTGNGEFVYPTTVYIDGDDNIYVGDGDNGRIQVFDSNRNFITSFGSYGSGDGQLDYPFDLDIASNGNIYVIDTYNNRVAVFDSSYNFLFNFGSSGSGDGQFSYPYCLVADGTSLYVCDSGNDRIQEFDLDGNYVTQHAIQGPYGITTDKNGNFYVADGYDAFIGVYDSSFNYVGSISQYGYEEGEFIFAAYMRVDDDGNLYVVDQELDRGYKLRLDLQAPTGSVVINSGEASTSSADVTLTLSAADVHSSVTQMMISESPSFTGGVWETYATSLPFSLTDVAGTKTVYVKYRDVFNQESSAYSDTITLLAPVDSGGEDNGGNEGEETPVSNPGTPSGSDIPPAQDDSGEDSGNEEEYVIVIKDKDGNILPEIKVVIDGVEYTTNERGEITLQGTSDDYVGVPIAMNINGKQVEVIPDVDGVVKIDLEQTNGFDEETPDAVETPNLPEDKKDDFNYMRLSFFVLPIILLIAYFLSRRKKASFAD